MAFFDEEDFDALIRKLQQVHQNQVSTLQKKVQRLQSQLRQYKGRASSSKVDLGPALSDGASRSLGGSTEDLSLSVEASPKNETPCPTIATPNSRKTHIIFGKAAGNVSVGGEDEDQIGTKGLARLLSRPLFEATICMMIFANAVVFAMESQNKGMQFGHTFFGGDLPGHFWPGGDLFFEVLEVGFGIIFTLEVVLRLLAHRCAFFCGMWNWLDLGIVLVWIISRMARDAMPVNSQVLRLARLIRLFRLLRLVRRIQQFDSLYLMSTAIRSSFGILGWTAALLFIIQMLFALVLNQILYGFYFSEDLLQEGDQELKDRFELVYTYFGTFSRSLLTMFEITLANWPPVCRALTENVTEWFMIFFLIHKVTMGFAVIGVINGVLMQETFKVASCDDTIMMRTKQKAMQNHIKKMRLLFEEADTSEDGKVDLDEFKEILADSELKAWLGAMELDIRDVGEAWDLLQTESGGQGGGLTAEQLVKGVAKLQGTAKSLDLMKVIKEQNSIKHKLDKLDKSFRSQKHDSLPHIDANPADIHVTDDEVHFTI